MRSNESAMMDRACLFEFALDSLPEGVALLDCEGGVVFWNQAAEAVTGYGPVDLVSRAVPEGLKPLLDATNALENSACAIGARDRGALMQARHQLGHGLPVIARKLILRNRLGEPAGTAILFHPAERLDALPRGDSAVDGELDACQTEMEERLQSEFEDFERDGQTLGILWIAVDQGRDLRRTHGAPACQVMLEKVGHVLAAGLRPTEEIGRWGDDEFLVIAHERTPEMLASHARTLAGLARTTDFRWWGDRLSITVSVGAAQAAAGDSLQQLLHGARDAMECSIREGGNRVSVAHKRMEAMEDGVRSGADCGGRA